MSPALGCIDPSSYRLTIEGEILKISETSTIERDKNSRIDLKLLEKSG